MQRDADCFEGMRLGELSKAITAKLLSQKNKIRRTLDLTKALYGCRLIKSIILSSYCHDNFRDFAKLQALVMIGVSYDSLWNPLKTLESSYCHYRLAICRPENRQFTGYATLWPLNVLRSLGGGSVTALTSSIDALTRDIARYFNEQSLIIVVYPVRPGLSYREPISPPPTT